MGTKCLSAPGRTAHGTGRIGRKPSLETAPATTQHRFVTSLRRDSPTDRTEQTFVSRGAVDTTPPSRQPASPRRQDLEAAAAPSTEVGDQPGSGIRWIRRYISAKESGELGTFCVYEADSPEAIRAHAAAADLPIDEIVPIADTVVVRPDPASVAA